MTRIAATGKLEQAVSVLEHGSCKASQYTVPDMDVRHFTASVLPGVLPPRELEHAVSVLMQEPCSP